MKIGNNTAAGELSPRVARQMWRELNALYYLVLNGSFRYSINVELTLLGKKHVINNENDARKLLQQYHKILMPEKQLYKVVHNSLHNIFFHHCLEHDGKVEDIFQCNISKRGLENVFGEFTLPSPPRESPVTSPNDKE